MIELWPLKVNLIEDTRDVRKKIHYFCSTRIFEAALFLLQHYYFNARMKKAIVSVTNDLTTDQRVDRVCRTLTKSGFKVQLVGRELPGSLPLASRPYQTKRIRLLFRKGPQFYAEYNIRLFFYLLFHRSDLLISNDLDTLLANCLASQIGKRILIHDCHEYFRGVPELTGRKFASSVWKQIEDFCFPKLKAVYAVNGSIAQIYSEEYGKEVAVVRNVPFRKVNRTPKAKSDLDIPSHHKVILYQGAVNVDRGIEEAVQAMQFLKTPATLIIAGTGDVFDNIASLVTEKGVDDKVILLGQIPLEQLHAYTLMADIGLSIEKDVSLNYHYCLPNKFMDYIQAHVPVLISPLPEMKSIVDRYGIGECIESHDPQALAAKLDAMFTHPERLSNYKTRLTAAAAELCWENEEKVLLNILEKYG